jgi:hypothetical protein
MSSAGPAALDRAVGILLGDASLFDSGGQGCVAG